MSNENFGPTINLSDLAERHRCDPRFHAMVEMLVAYMMSNKIAPDEIRDAAYVASIKFMSLNPVRDITYRNDEWHIRRQFDPEGEIK